jgi:hypothetical protein
MIHFVFGEIAFLRASTFTSYVHKSTSTKTGTNLFCIIGVIVVGNHAATVIISSHGNNCLSHNSFEVNVVNAKRLAELHEFVVATNFTQRNSASHFSNFSFHLHSVQ